MSIRQIVSAAIESGSRAIDPENLAWMEECFHARLRDVRLHFSPESSAANRAFGSLAFAVEDHICFRELPPSFQNRGFASLLAHEISHVIQHCLGVHTSGDCFPSARQLEMEAGAASARVMAGLPAIELTHDLSGIPRCYGPAGHYYTAFYAALAVGLPYATANRIAFYTQLPDLVCELDAIESGKYWGLWAAAVYFEPIPKACSQLLPEEYQKFWQASTDVSIDKMLHHWQIQAGLHALTGGDALQETEHRRKILRRFSPIDKEILQLGLAVHAFGDSYAHRDFHDGKNMYGPPAGHAADLINDPLWMEGLTSGHDPDRIALRKPLYFEYANDLYLELARCSASAPIVKLDEYLGNLQEMASRSKDDDQAKFLKQKLQALAKGEDLTDFYDPADDAVPWDNFLKDGKHLTLGYTRLEDAYKCAADWCGSAEPFKFSVHADFGLRIRRAMDGFENDVATVLGLNLSPEEWMRQMGGF